MNIDPIQTAVKGVEPAVDIDIEKLDEARYQVTCPKQSVRSVMGRKKHMAIFDPAICASCPFQNQCPTMKRRKGRVLYFSRDDYRRKRRHKMITQLPPERRRLRPNVEATVHEFTFRMPRKKLKVRGAFKTTIFAYTAALAINFGRIFRYVLENPDKFRLFFVFVKKYFQRRFGRIPQYATPMAAANFIVWQYLF